jgi:hypothetical protein
MGNDMIEPIGWCEIHVNSTTQFNFHNLAHYYESSTVLGPAASGLSGFAPAEAELDVWDRNTLVGDWSVEFVDDGQLRDIAATYSLKGKRVVLKHGDAAKLNVLQLEEIHSELIIDDVIPEPGKLTLICKDWQAWLFDTQVTPKWRDPDHPKRVLRDLLQDRIGSVVTVDSTFDETANTGTSHHVICRQFANFAAVQGQGRDLGITPTPIEEELFVNALDQANEICKLTRGALVVSGSQYKYFEYDRTRAGEASFTADNIENFRQLENYERTVTDFTSLGRAPIQVDEPVSWSRTSDAAAETAFTYSPGIALPDQARAYEEKLNFDWLHSVSNLGAPAVRSRNRVISPNGGLPVTGYGTSIITVFVPLYAGFSGSVMSDGSGNRLSPPSTTQQTEHTLNGTTREAWFWMTNEQPFDRGLGVSQPGKRELVRATAFTYNVAGNIPFTITTPDNGAGGAAPFDRNYWVFGEYTIERGFADNYTQTGLEFNWDDDVESRTLWIYDITVAKAASEIIIDRHSRGLPVIEFDCPIDFAELEVGDFVFVPNSIYFDDEFPAGSASPSTVKFEVIGTAESLFGSQPGLRIRAAKVRTSTEPVTTADDPPIVTPGPSPILSFPVIQRSSGDAVVARSLGETVFTSLSHGPTSFYPPTP